MLKRVFSYIFLTSLLILSGCRTSSSDIELPTRVPTSSASPIIFDDVTNDIPDAPVPNQVVITFNSHTTSQDRAAYIESIGGTVVQSITELNTLVINIPASTPLPESPAIATTEPDYYAVALQDDPLYPQQWALPAINAPNAWAQLPIDTTKITIAVIDSGVCLNHPDLVDRITNGYDFIEDDNLAQDDYGHGCAVAGVIAANHNEIGIAGVAPNTMILPLRVLDANGIGTYSDVAAAIVYATDNGAKIINLSLGGTNTSTVLQNAINYAIGHDVMVIAAAGNTGGPMLYPAAYDSVIAVGSVDQDLQVSDFSAQGDIYAPGSGILSLQTEGSYGLVNGTSFAAPHVSGMAALSIAQGTAFVVDGQIVGSNSSITSDPEIINTDNNIPTNLNNPTHYMVFEHNTTGEIAPLFHQYVAMPQALQSLSAEQLAAQTAQSTRNAYQATVTLVDNNNTVVYQNVVKIPRWTRGEFHAEDGSGEIDSNFIELEEASFVVRVPVIPNTSLLLQTSLAASTTLFDPFAIANDATLPLAGLSFNMPQPLSGQAGDPANRLDILLIGEGYTAAEYSKFQTDATNAETNFASISPFLEYSDFMNFTQLFVASNQSGADHPPYNASCSTTFNCCRDSAASSDPKAGTYVNTAFDGSFCWSINVHRLLSVSSSKIYAAAASAPNWDEILVIVNDDVYGGAGGSFGVFSTHSSAILVAQHEFGHSFIDLADEYESAYPGYPACSDTNGVTYDDCEDNVTNQTTRASIKWLRWIDAGTPVVTPETSPYTTSMIDGLYEGARYLTSGMYRPTYNSIMRSLGQPFNNESAESYVLKLYNGWGGSPYNGIDNIEPGTESHTPNSTIPTSGNITLSADLLAPTGHPLDIKWYVDNQLVATDSSETTASYTFVPVGADLYTVRLDVTDVAGFVHPTLESTLTTSRTWYVDVQSADLSITKSADTQVLAGSDLSYTLTVTNNGPSAATSVVVTDTLSVELTLISTSPDVCSANGQVITCNLGTMANGGQSVVTLNTLVDADASGDITNMADVTSPVVDPDTGNNADSAVTTVTAVTQILINEQEFQQALNQHLMGDIAFVLVDLVPDGMNFTIQLTDGTVGDVSISATQSDGFTVFVVDSVSINGSFQAAVNVGLLPMVDASLNTLFDAKYGPNHDVDYLSITNSHIIGLFVAE